MYFFVRRVDPCSPCVRSSSFSSANGSTRVDDAYNGTARRAGDDNKLAYLRGHCSFRCGAHRCEMELLGLCMYQSAIADVFPATYDDQCSQALAVQCARWPLNRCTRSAIEHGSGVLVQCTRQCALQPRLCPRSLVIHTKDSCWNLRITESNAPSRV